MTYTVAALYRFVTLPDPAALREELKALFTPDELCGTLLIAGEGVNGTLAGSPGVIRRLLDVLAEKIVLSQEDVKVSTAAEKPFGRLKFQVKREIIAFHQPGLDATRAGQYVSAGQWNALIADPEVLVLDTRNRYEIDFGTFAGAADPGIERFSEFTDYVRENLDPARHRKVAMFCTGGIRCEKASAFMLAQGFEQVYHLKGGILKYLENVPAKDSRWKGRCFVFDGRVALGHGDFAAE